MLYQPQHTIYLLGNYKSLYHLRSLVEGDSGVGPSGLCNCGAPVLESGQVAPAVSLVQP